MKLKECIIILLGVIYEVYASTALDHDLYESVLDPELCDEQIKYLQRNNTLLKLQFLDAGLRLPKGILTGNFVDLGNYHECLEINQKLQDFEVSGKYCLIDILFNQNTRIESPLENSLQEWLPRIENFQHNNEDLEKIKDFRKFIEPYEVFESMRSYKSDEAPATNLSTFNMRLAMCLPRPCSTQQALESLYLNVSAIGLKYNDVYCRLPDDKKWVAGDTVSLIILSCIGILAILGTGYDLHHTVIKKRDAREANKIITAFSVYTNTRNFFVFKSTPGTIECLDGIRALAMTWVILGHTFSSLSTFPIYNMLDIADWSSSTRSVWVQAAPLSVDTFFMLSGLLLVYTSAGKFSGMKLLKNIHMFYVNRLLRLFPLLAFAILLEISIVNRASDGPLWPTTVTSRVDNCRTHWWSTLVHFQNYINPGRNCVPHSWYIAIDTQLHLLSPIILFWVVSGKKIYAWISLACALIVSLTSASIYIFLNNFKFTPNSSPQEIGIFMSNYYINTLTRAPPFFIGMIFGYVLYIWRGKQMKLPKVLVALLWILAFVSSSLAVYSQILSRKPDFDNQDLDNFKNAYIRSVWSAALGWMIVACMHGYAGPINWFLSLQKWKPFSRLSYGMYLLHLSVIFIHTGSRVSPFHFSVPSVTYLFLGHFMFACIIAFVATIVVDAPCSVLIKLALGGGPRKAKENENVDVRPANGVENNGFTKTEPKLE